MVGERRDAFAVTPGAKETEEAVRERLRRNMDVIRDRIDDALARTGRSGQEVVLVGVTKTVPVEVIEMAVGEGLRHVGENRVQEARTKFASLSRLGITFHMVGTLQTNKVKEALSMFDLIHSLDRPSLALEIGKRASDGPRRPSLLVQVNVAGEATKHGLPPGEVVGFLQWMNGSGLDLKVEGLMTIAPPTSDPEEVRPVFRELARLAREVEKLKLKGVEMRYLSMGMSGDYVVAVEEGANMVRLGTAIFGPRTGR